MITGAVLSRMVKVAVVEALFEHPSLAVKVTVLDTEHPEVKGVKLLVQVTVFPTQLSVACAPPREATQEFNAV